MTLFFPPKAEYLSIIIWLYRTLTCNWFLFWSVWYGILFRNILTIIKYLIERWISYFWRSSAAIIAILIAIILRSFQRHIFIFLVIVFCIPLLFLVLLFHNRDINLYFNIFLCFNLNWLLKNVNKLLLKLFNHHTSISVSYPFSSTTILFCITVLITFYFIVLFSFLYKISVFSSSILLRLDYFDSFVCFLFFEFYDSFSLNSSNLCEKKWLNVQFNFYTSWYFIHWSSTFLVQHFKFFKSFDIRWFKLTHHLRNVFLSFLIYFNIPCLMINVKLLNFNESLLLLFWCHIGIHNHLTEHLHVDFFWLINIFWKWLYSHNFISKHAFIKYN